MVFIHTIVDPHVGHIEANSLPPGMHGDPVVRFLAGGDICRLVTWSMEGEVEKLPVYQAIRLDDADHFPHSVGDEIVHYPAQNGNAVELDDA